MAPESHLDDARSDLGGANQGPKGNRPCEFHPPGLQKRQEMHPDH
jgi:hypothetical protein